MHRPVLINKTHQQLKLGQTIQETCQILESAWVPPAQCCWHAAGVEPICSESETCRIPPEDFTGKDSPIELAVTHMGQGYAHHTYRLSFNSAGRISAIGAIEIWD